MDYGKILKNKGYLALLTILRDHDPDLFMRTMFKIISEHKDLVLSKDHTTEAKLNALNQMINYFESPKMQEFEKCAIIKNWIDEVKRL
jgi:hypothetical protein